MRLPGWNYSDVGFRAESGFAGFTVEGSGLSRLRFRVYPSPSCRSLVGLSFRAWGSGFGV